MRKNPWIAAGLSLVPGAGHFYIGRFKKGFALFCIDAALVAALFFSSKRLAYVLAAMIYLVTMIPGVLETYQAAKTGETAPRSESKIYVVLMLLVTGFPALPLLWQNTRFSPAAKRVWTAAVAVLAVLFFGALFFWGSAIEKFLTRI